MNESLDQLMEIKKELVRKAVYHYRIGDIENDIDGIDFDNKVHIQRILKKFRTLKTVEDKKTKKNLLNQMIANRKQIPDVEINPYYMPERIIEVFEEDDQLIKEIMGDDTFFEEIDEDPFIEEIIVEDWEDILIEKIEFKYPLQKIPIVSEKYITKENEFVFPKLFIPTVSRKYHNFKFPKQKIPIVAKQFISKNKRPLYYCNECKHYHFLDSKKGKDHKKIMANISLKELSSTVMIEDTIDKFTLKELIKIANNSIKMVERWLKTIKAKKEEIIPEIK